MSTIKQAKKSNTISEGLPWKFSSGTVSFDVLSAALICYESKMYFSLAIFFDRT